MGTVPIFVVHTLNLCTLNASVCFEEAPMPRSARFAPGGICYHVINRGNLRARVFHDDSDYRRFLALMAKAGERVQMRILGFCLMPNHFHLVLWPFRDGDLGCWMQWLMTSQVRRHHKIHQTEGHLWQGRYKSFPIQQDGHLLTVLRYVERNPLRAGLVPQAQDWPWSSLHRWQGQESPVPLTPGPVPRPANWRELVNREEPTSTLEALRRSVNRGLPWGREEWVEQNAERFGIELTPRPRGRPPKQK